MDLRHICSELSLAAVKVLSRLWSSNYRGCLWPVNGTDRLLREVENSEAPPALFQEKCSEWCGEGPAADVKGFIKEITRPFKGIRQLLMMENC